MHKKTSHLILVLVEIKPVITIWRATAWRVHLIPIPPNTPRWGGMSSTPWMVEPDKDNNSKYEKLLPVFALSAEYQAKISDALREIEL